MVKHQQRGTRERNAAATQTAILEAARHQFSEHGYEGTNLRKIAAEVGVNVALVIRYFQSKEALFVAALSQPLGLEHLFQGDRSTLGERLVRYVLAKDTTTDFDPLLALLRSTSSGPGAAWLNASIEEQFVAPVASQLTGDATTLRATLIATVLLGLVVGRGIVRSPALLGNDMEAIIARVAPVIQGYIE